MKKHIINLLISLPLLLQAQTTLPPDMVYVEGGTFTMGCTPEQVPCNTFGYDLPIRVIRIQSFLIAKYEITRKQFFDVMGYFPATYNYGTEINYPVHSVNLFESVNFCNKISLILGKEPCYYSDENFTQYFDTIAYSCQTGLSEIRVFLKSDANGYRLPTEAEWEYAARGGKSSQQTFYIGSELPEEIGWFNGNSNAVSHEIGIKRPNELGVFDMGGNLNEWCFDLSAGNYGYGVLPADYECQRNLGSVLRGGSYDQDKQLMKPSYRQKLGAIYRCSASTIRIAKNVE